MLRRIEVVGFVEDSREIVGVVLLVVVIAVELVVAAPAVAVAVAAVLVAEAAGSCAARLG